MLTLQSGTPADIGYVLTSARVEQIIPNRFAPLPQPWALGAFTAGSRDVEVAQRVNANPLAFKPVAELPLASGQAPAVTSPHGVLYLSGLSKLYEITGSRGVVRTIDFAQYGASIITNLTFANDLLYVETANGDAYTLSLDKVSGELVTPPTLIRHTALSYQFCLSGSTIYSSDGTRTDAYGTSSYVATSGNVASEDRTKAMAMTLAMGGQRPYCQPGSVYFLGLKHLYRVTPVP
jgi:hypothetical protein